MATKARAKSRVRYRAAPARPAAEPRMRRVLESYMGETNGGSSIERVPGFDPMRAMTAGFPSSRVSGPTFLISAPDGGFFSTPPLPPGPPKPPEGTAAFGRFGKPENIIGFDDRIIVGDTAVIPWRCICHLEITFERGAAGVGTGWFAGPRTVITAGHCLFDRKHKRKATQVRVIPGRNGTSAPYGYVVSTDFKIAPGWTEAANDEAAAPFDFGAIAVDKEVAGEPFGERIGFFGLRSFDPDEKDELRLLMVNNAGYPFEPDKPYGTLWFNAGRVHMPADERLIDPRFLEYMVDTEGGQSGSPIFIFDAKTNQRQVVAIHTTGNFVNRGLRITAPVFDQVRRWTQR